MNTRNTLSKSKAGFTALEIIIALVVLALVVGGGATLVRNARGGAADSMKMKIATEMTEAASALHEQGVDETEWADVEEAIDAVVAGLNVQMNAGGEAMWYGYEGPENPNPAAYNLVAATEDTPASFTPILDERNVPPTLD